MLAVVRSPVVSEKVSTESALTSVASMRLAIQARNVRDLREKLSKQIERPETTLPTAVGLLVIFG